MYTGLKLIHVSAVVLSGTGFVLRYALAAVNRLPSGPSVRVAPHVIDTVLLASALALAWVGNWNPLDHPWLEAKLVGLIVYIVAGTVALKRGRSTAVRAVAFAVALLTYGYVVAAAVTKSPWGLLDLYGGGS